MQKKEKTTNKYDIVKHTGLFPRQGVHKYRLSFIFLSIWTQVLTYNKYLRFSPRIHCSLTTSSPLTDTEKPHYLLKRVCVVLEKPKQREKGFWRLCSQARSEWVFGPFSQGVKMSSWLLSLDLTRLEFSEKNVFLK